MKSIHPINPRIHNRGSYFSRAARAALACVALAAAVLVPSSAVVFADDDTIRTFLSGAAIGGVTPTGHADFRDRGPADRKFQVEVQNVNLPAGTVLNVLVNNQQTATMTLDGFRAGRVELETERGQAVPAVTTGTTVAVTNQSGANIVSGAFGSVANPTPTPSATPTPGATPSPTPNASPTPGATPSPSPTPDATPSPTPGSTPSPTPTPGATPSPTPTSTPSPTPTPGATPSPTPAMFEFEADLVGAPINGVTPRGDAEFEIEFNNREFRVRIEDVNLPAGTQLRVLVDGAFIGNISVAPGLDRSELRLKTEDGQTVPQVNSRTRVVVADATGATLLAGSFSNIPQQLPNPGPAPMPTPGPNGDLRIESRLAGAPIGGLTPTGHARFRTRADGQRQFNVEAEKVNLPVGTILQVFVDGVKLGELVLPSTLEAELERNSNDGEFVPNVTTATRVVVTDSQGRTLLSGGFNTAGLPIVTPNDIDDTLFFVEQQYRDFLGREADDGGLGFWANEVAKCGGGPTCVTIMRANTSAAFFLSIEFQETGYLLYRLNKASYGTMPRRNPFMVDMQALVRGVVVGTDGWQARLAANKAATLASWVERPEFKERFGSMTNEQYVDALLSNANLSADQQLRSDLVAALNAGSQTRAAVLQTVADNPAFRAAEQNPAFVLMQYFGYLHRNPDELDGSMDGFLHWLKKLEEYNGDWRRAEMVRAFVESFEYRGRFLW